MPSLLGLINRRSDVLPFGPEAPYLAIAVSALFLVLSGLGFTWLLSLLLGIAYIAADRLIPTMFGRVGTDTLTIGKALHPWPLLLLMCVVVEEFQGATRTRVLAICGLGWLILRFLDSRVSPDKIPHLEVPPLTLTAFLAVLGSLLLTWACYRPKRRVSFRVGSGTGFEWALLGLSIVALTVYSVAQMAIEPGSGEPGAFARWSAFVLSAITWALCAVVPSVVAKRKQILTGYGVAISVVALILAKTGHSSLAVWVTAEMFSFTLLVFFVPLLTLHRSQGDARILVALSALPVPISGLITMSRLWFDLERARLASLTSWLLFGVCVLATVWTLSVRSSDQPQVDEELAT